MGNYFIELKQEIEKIYSQNIARGFVATNVDLEMFVNDLCDLLLEAALYSLKNQPESYGLQDVVAKMLVTFKHTLMMTLKKTSKLHREYRALTKSSSGSERNLLIDLFKFDENFYELSIDNATMLIISYEKLIDIIISYGSSYSGTMYNEIKEINTIHQKEKTSLLRVIGSIKNNKGEEKEDSLERETIEKVKKAILQLKIEGKKTITQLSVAKKIGIPNTTIISRITKGKFNELIGKR